MLQFWRRFGEQGVQIIKRFLGKEFRQRSEKASCVTVDLDVIFIINEFSGLGMVHIGGKQFLTV